MKANYSSGLWKYLLDLNQNVTFLFLIGCFKYGKYGYHIIVNALYFFVFILTIQIPRKTLESAISLVNLPYFPYKTGICVQGKAAVCNVLL